MKASELKLYNFVFYKGKVMQIQTNYELFKACIDCDRGINIEPIALTQDWLLMFGFKVMGVKDYLLSVNRDTRKIITISTKPKKKHEHGCNFELFQNDRKGIKHVHELQNLYHALTRQELKIK